MSLVWKGKGINEKAYDKFSKKIIIECDKKYFRPLDVNTLLGDAKKARKELKWNPKINFDKGLKETIIWYLENKKFLKDISKKNYEKRLGLKI